MSIEIDQDGARRAVRSWDDWATHLAMTARSLGADLEAMRVGGRWSASCSSLDSAETQVRASAEFIRRVSDRVAEADGADVRFTRFGLIGLWALSVGSVERQHQFGGCRAGGDPGGTNTTVARSPWIIDGGTAHERGINTMVQGLADTMNGCVIENDEFEIIDVGDGKYVVVLAGVIDLSEPHLGYDERSESTRDLDQGARQSATSTDLSDNEYARFVAEALAGALPPGAEISIIGHSYGADTALDLAADPEFNGEHFVVSNVFAAGYHSRPQFGALPEDTRVLAIQNDKDAAVIAETALHGPGIALEGGLDTWDGVGDLDPQAASEGFADMIGGIWTTTVDTFEFVVDRGDKVLELGLNGVVEAATDGYVEGPFDTTWGDVLYLDVGSQSNGPHTNIVFDGNDSRSGHGQENYNEFLFESADPRVIEFAEALDAGGFTTGGDAQAVDISKWRD